MASAKGFRAKIKSRVLDLMLITESLSGSYFNGQWKSKSHMFEIFHNFLRICPLSILPVSRLFMINPSSTFTCNS